MVVPWKSKTLPRVCVNVEDSWVKFTVEKKKKKTQIFLSVPFHPLS